MPKPSTHDHGNKPSSLEPSPVTVRIEETHPSPPARQPDVKSFKSISILQAIHVCLCMMIFPYMLTVTLSRWQVNLWLAALVSALIGTGIFLLLYRRTRDVKLFKFE